MARPNVASPVACTQFPPFFITLFLIMFRTGCTTPVDAFTSTSFSRKGPSLAPTAATVTLSTTVVALSSASDHMDVSRMLYQDQQDAMARRASLEKEMLDANTKELLAPSFAGGNKKNTKVNAKAGTGFGAASSKSKRKVLKNTYLQRLALQQAKVVREMGVLRIDQAMSAKCADALRSYVLHEQSQAYVLAQEQPALARSLFGVENFRKHRCDLQLNLLRSSNDESSQHEVADALEEVLGQDGTLRYIYEELVTTEGEFYELAAVITNPGSDRQQVHPDLPFTKEPPLYVIFLALQDVTMEMGPTSFLLETHTEQAMQSFQNVGHEENIISNNQDSRDTLLRSSDCVVSTLKKGDAVLFDARILHCGNANACPNHTTRALFNFSFRNPAVRGSLGYAGSIRPRYEKKMTLADVATCLNNYREGNPEPFAIYGNGLV